jgi:methionyl aminopeptidase
VLTRAEDLERMREACRVARQVLATVGRAVAPGITTDELDAIAHEETLRHDAYPSPLNYHGFPKSICTSVNEVICHGIPDLRPLEKGDIVNCDITVYLHGMHGDCSETLLVGEVDESARRLVEVTRECLFEGIGQVRPGVRVAEIGRAIEAHATRHGYSVVRAFVGHGIGRGFHMEPQVPHYYDPRFRGAIVPGMTFTIEPMINVGSWRHVLWEDDWTAVTEDLQLSAQFEHTVLCTEQGVEILTLDPEVEQPFPH